VSSTGSIECSNTGRPVFRISDFKMENTDIILLFGRFADDISKQFDTMGLVLNRDYIKTELI
jgi:hypothetical protein